MKLTESIGLKGILSIFKVTEGSRTLVYKEENLIVRPARQKIINMIYQEALVSDPIKTLKIGIAGTVDPEGYYAKTPTVSTTELNYEIADVGVEAVPADDGMSVTFLADLDTTQGNQQLISEAGLAMASGELFNIKYFPGIPKTSDFSIHFEWEIKIA